MPFSFAAAPGSLTGDIPCNCLHYSESGPIAVSTCLRCCGTGVADPRRDATLKRNLDRRYPTQEEILAFDGAHCKRLYASICTNWQCPCCHRTKYQLMRWTKLFPNRPNSYMGWAGGLHEHHDHGAGASRFAKTLVCEQCNSADAAAKRALNLPKSFSFSPAEIRCFVIGFAHGWHLINYVAAQRLYQAATVLPPPPLTFWPLASTP